MTEALSRLRSGLALLVRADGVPELPGLPFERARVISQGEDGRVSLQLVNRSGDRPDLLDGRIPLWCGTSGVSVDPTPGQEVVLGYSRADLSDPVAFLAAPRGQPGHVPLRVRHEAVEEIAFVANSLGIVRVGPEGTQKVALGPALDSVLADVQAFAATVSTATTVPQIAAAAATLQGALSAITLTSATRLEAI